MAAVTNIVEIKRRLAQGKGFYLPFINGVAGTGTSAGATSGSFTLSVISNGLGTTYPSTLQTFLLPPGTSDLRGVYLEMSCSQYKSFMIGYFYLLGTVNLAATGNQFTHSGTFTRLRRTQFGVANSNISMLPVIYVTTANTTTAPIFTFSYADQDGNATVGTTNFTFPAAAIAAQSGFFMMPDETDCAMQDVTQLNIGTAGTAGAANVYGFEAISSVQIQASDICIDNKVYGGLSLPELRPAIPDAGSVTSFLGALCLSGYAGTMEGMVIGVTNT